MRRLSKVLLVLILLFIMGAVFLSPLRTYLRPQHISAYLARIRESPFSPFIYIFFYAAATVFAVPGLPLTLMAAPAFGFLKGLLLVVIASNLGCQLTFFIARYAGKHFVSRFIKQGSFLDKVNGHIEKNGFIYMLYIRVIPLFPFNLVNYLPGVTSISYVHYTLATLIGMLPATTVYVYISYTAADIRNNPWGIIASIAVLVIFTVITTILSRRSRFNH